MAEETIFVNDATSEKPIQEIERLLHQLDGIERVLLDTSDGEIKVEFDDEKISIEQIVNTLKQHNFC
ncbi:heavy-metal-associated domain-containing protein [Heyndrickxia camelliae]|uniref:HMA domain-containing protein n=1 Tax=Heyndrickxia camelliae TaxID=1707093 RepID=A0A2N3LPS5_9BACI|nr:cation transporter [Heyndrickxia camelliae]PKR86554.1 hypothetical protein CWO92_00345 [Heyndrickxia camelliae]